MGLSFLEIRTILQELAPLSGALLQEVYQPTPSDLVLELRAARESRLLLLSAHGRLSRLHPITRRPPNPRNPLSFQMLCRKELGGRLTALAQCGDDRIVRLSFQGAQRRALVAELTDRHANIFLVDEADQVLGMLMPSRRDSRQLTPGRIYTPLPPPPQPLRATDRFLQHPPEQSYLEAVETFFTAEHQRQQAEQLREQLRVQLRRELKRLDRRKKDLECDLARAEQAERHRRFGDLLQIHLAKIPRGRSHVVLPDAFQEDADAVVEIPLDPQLDAIGNVQRHYRLYRKYDASIPIVLERVEATDYELARLAALESAVDSTHDLERLEQLEREAALQRRVQRTPSASSSRPRERLPYHRYLTASGIEIRVGRSGRDNDTLTFRLSRGNDFWLHVRGRPGAHVVIPARDAPPDLETLLDAAALALRHSGASPGDRGDVSYTRVKYVRKVPGDHPGLVTYSQDRTLYVDLSPERLARLTRAEGDD